MDTLEIVYVNDEVNLKQRPQPLSNDDVIKYQENSTRQ